MFRVTAVWNGFAGAPGYSNFYFAGTGETAASAQAAANDVRTFFESIRGDLPSSVNVQVQPVVAVLDPTDGELSSEITVATTPVLVAGSGTAGYSVASGVCVNWKTSDVVAGRRLRGRTFLVPLTGTSYEANGTLTAAALTAIRNAAGVLATVNAGSPLELVVWSRPKKVTEVGTGVVTTAPGTTGIVTSAVVNDKVSILRSRRD